MLGDDNLSRAGPLWVRSKQTPATVGNPSIHGFADDLGDKHSRLGTVDIRQLDLLCIIDIEGLHITE